MREILRFNIEEYIELCLFMKDGKLIYGKYQDNNPSYNVSELEKQLINEVLFSLFPSNNIQDFGYIKYDNERIKHLYDFTNKFHILSDENNNITKSCLFLNYIFNNEEEYCTNKINYMKRSESRYIRRNVRVGNKIISVLTLGAFLLTLSIGTYKGISWIKYFKDKKNYYENVLEYSNNILELSEIENIINNNSNLSDAEKKLFLSEPEFFKDNLEYFDYYTVRDNLNKLHIEYLKTDGDVVGMYGDFTNYGNNKGRIRMYGTTNFSDTKKSYLSHEFLHAFTKKYNSYNYLYEGLHVLFNNEYFGNNLVNYDDAYQVLNDEIYILCELIDEDILRKYHADDNINYLFDELVKIIPDSNMAIKLLYDMDFVYRIAILKNNNASEYEKLKEEYQIKMKDIKNALKAFYEAKYKISIYDDNYIHFLFDRKSACTKIASELNLSIDAFKLADEFTTVKQFKKIFRKNENNNLILNFCDEVKEVPKYFTLESVLSGETGRLYRTKEDIDLEMTEDGRYIAYVCEPSHFADYEIISYSDKLKSGKNTY